jgi:hypothetical protein
VSARAARRDRARKAIAPLEHHGVAERIGGCDGLVDRFGEPVRWDRNTERLRGRWQHRLVDAGLVVRRIAQRLAHQLLHARAVAAEMARRMAHELEQQPYRDLVARNDEPGLDFGDHRDERQQPLHRCRFVAQHARPRDEARMQRERAPRRKQ